MTLAKPDDTAPLFRPSLRGGLETARRALRMQMAGARCGLIGTHFLRSGGARCLYATVGDLLPIQGWGRWRPNSCLRYWRRYLITLDPVSRILSIPTGTLVQLQHQAHRTSAQVRLADCRAWRIGRSAHKNPVFGGRCEDSDHSGTEASNPSGESAGNTKPYGNLRGSPFLGGLFGWDSVHMHPMRALPKSRGPPGITLALHIPFPWMRVYAEEELPKVAV